MSNSKPSKNPQDIELLKSDVASFASSLGLSSSLPSSGFNDSDFRKTGLLKLHKHNKARNNDTDEKNQLESKPGITRKPKSKIFNKNNEKPQFEHRTGKTQKMNSKTNNQIAKPKPPLLSLGDDNSNIKAKQYDKYKNLPKLPLVKATVLSSEWYKDAAELEEKVLGGGEKNQRVEVKNVDEWKGVVEKKKELGERLMWQYTQDFDSSKGKSGDMKMVIAAQKAGTEADKVTAFEIMVGENPIANLRSLDALLGMVTSKVGKRYAFKGFKALTELLIKLLPDRKLKMLLQRPVNNLPEAKDGYSLLLFWYWEECLKQRYERFVVALEEASRDMLPQLKDKALKTMYVLLTSKSEQERRLLSALVNKLGDPQNKSASSADFHLSNLISDHPNMKAVVIDEVDSFLFRPHLGVRAKYHAVNFLSQIRLCHKGDGPKVAKRLIDVYFALFKVLITEAGGRQQVDKGKRVGDKKASGSYKESKPESSSESHVELDSRLLSALLTGVNRAFPYVASNEADDIIEMQTPMLFQLVHSKNFNVGVQALMLLDKISSKNQIVSDRFYRALYSKLLLPAALNSSKAEMFIGLLLRAMKGDVNLKRVSAFSKRLLQVALQQPPQYACGCLFLLSEVLKARPPLWNMVLQNESVDEDLEHFEDVAEENNTESSTAAKKEKDVAEFAHSGEVANSDSDSSEEKDNLPASDSDESDNSDEAEELLIRYESKDHQKLKEVSDYNGHKPQVPSTRIFLPGGYNPQHREPSYCNADRTSWWELMVLASHVHPSVATMAGTLLSGTNIVYNGNPLNDLSLTAFLDKFMEKKPKASTWHGASQIEPAKKLDMANNLIGPEILSLAEMDVPPEDLVFHKFYMNKMNSSKKSKKKKKKKSPEDEAAEELFEVDGGGRGDSDESGDDVDGGDESDNEEIENMLDSANPSVSADGDYDYDDLDQVANEDDDDLVGNVSDAEVDIPSDIAQDEDFVATPDYDNSDGDPVDIGDVDDASDGEDGFNERKKKRKKAAASPFANLEEYEHLINEDSPTEKEHARNKRPKSRKKKRSSK